MCKFDRKGTPFVLLTNGFTFKTAVNARHSLLFQKPETPEKVIPFERCLRIYATTGRNPETKTKSNSVNLSTNVEYSDVSSITEIAFLI